MRQIFYWHRWAVFGAFVTVLGVTVFSCGSASAEAQKPAGAYELMYRMMGWPLPKPKPPPVMAPPPEQLAPIVRPPPKAKPKGKPKAKARGKPTPKQPPAGTPRPPPQRACLEGVPTTPGILLPCSEIRRIYACTTLGQQLAMYAKATPKQVAHGRKCLGM